MLSTFILIINQNYFLISLTPNGLYILFILEKYCFFKVVLFVFTNLFSYNRVRQNEALLFQVKKKDINQLKAVSLRKS